MLFFALTALGAKAQSPLKTLADPISLGGGND